MTRTAGRRDQRTIRPVLQNPFGLRRWSVPAASGFVLLGVVWWWAGSGIGAARTGSEVHAEVRISECVGAISTVIPAMNE
jgi:hypothetical protein